MTTIEIEGKRRLVMMLAAAVLVVGAPSCVRTGGEPRGNVGRYCDRLGQIERSDEPSRAEVEELIRAAPPEIKDDVRAVVAPGGSPFDDTPEARALLQRSRDLCTPSTTGP
jgi:hypothetical protein